MNKLAKLAAALAVSTLSILPAQAITITAYSNNFDGPVVTASGVTASLSGASVQSVQGLSGLGASGNKFGGNFLSSYGAGSIATLTLSGLPTHTGINLTGLLAALDSWDSSNGGCCSPDVFQITVDGVTVFNDTYNNAAGSVNNAAGLTDIGAGYVHRGFNGGWLDQAFDLESELTSLAHTGSTLTIDFLGTGAGWQAGTDEAWGFDNLLVELVGVTPPVTGVPEPMTLSLLGAGLAGLAALRRSRTA